MTQDTCGKLVEHAPYGLLESLHAEEGPRAPVPRARSTAPALSTPQETRSRSESGGIRVVNSLRRERSGESERAAGGPAGKPVRERELPPVQPGRLTAVRRWTIRRASRSRVAGGKHALALRALARRPSANLVTR